MKKNTQTRRHNVLITLGIGLLYLSAAQFGLLLNLDLHEITHYGPASGVALASVLFFDRRALPGIVLGALATIAVLLVRQSLEPTLLALSIALLTMGAFTAQPLIALILLRRLASPMPFWTHIKTFYRGLSVLLLVSLIPASVGVGALYVTGMMNSDEALSAWMLGTTGNFLGMVTIAPALYHYYF
jgi:hypothetical protein